MATYGTIYQNMRNKCNIKSKQRPFGKIFMSEFRSVILTVLIVVGALTLQKTMENALEVQIRRRFNNPITQTVWMLIFSVLLICVVILIVIAWQPSPVEQESEESDTAKRTAQ
jgi:uncharacterized membrane protein YidH (DUF202 family)